MILRIVVWMLFSCGLLLGLACTTLPTASRPTHRRLAGYCLAGLFLLLVCPGPLINWYCQAGAWLGSGSLIHGISHLVALAGGFWLCWQLGVGKFQGFWQDNGLRRKLKSVSDGLWYGVALAFAGLVFLCDRGRSMEDLDSWDD